MSRRRALLMTGRKKFHKFIIGYYPFDNDTEDKIAPKVNLSSDGSTPTLIDVGRIGNAVKNEAGTAYVLRNEIVTGQEGNINKYVFSDSTGNLPYTISVHVYLISAGTNRGATIIGFIGENSSVQATRAVWDLKATPGLNEIEFTKYSETQTANHQRYRIPSPPQNEWFQIIVSDDAQGNVKIWFENQLQVPIESTGGTGFIKFEATQGRFGMFNALGVPSAIRFLEGSIDDLAIYKGYAFTQEDVDYVNNNGNPRKALNI